MKHRNFGAIVAAMIVFAGSCSSVKSLPMELPAFDKQGHRGCRGWMPENSLPAMLKALEFGVTTLEMDAAITADGKVILSHEPFFNHEITTKPDGSNVTEAEEKSLNIYKMTYAETQQFDVGRKIHPRFPKQEHMAATKPLLSEIIDNAEAVVRLRNRVPVFYNIETKTQPATDNIFHPDPEVFVNTLMKVVEKKKITDRVVIQSFDFRTLIYLNKKYPKIKTAALIEGNDKRSLDEIIKVLGFTPTIYSPSFNLVTSTLVAECHAKNIRIIPWTVNDRANIERLKAMGVDGIISDYPDLFQ